MSEDKRPARRVDPSLADYKEADRGLTIVYTGDGKGKTTAAMGLALRAAGYGKRILVIQFVKTWFTGEKGGFAHVPGVEFVQAGKGFYKILGDKLPEDEHVRAAATALELARTKIASGQYDVVVLDEVIGSVTGGLLELAPVLELVDTRPAHIDLVLTGHRGHELPELLDRADLITEMRKIKHPYDQKILAKETIDY
ncbi:MAG TPA: cob(I)yrinic acid a,c-diamide adenosyltransferase [Candidatus Saccharimonadia bacterium]|nr:cob(I)yrinic acid a,c-diamide adenosyltransferase [Candidatus Saccharimonadia bacterium]